MPNKARLCCVLLITALSSVSAAWGQQSAEGELTARDMFRKATGRLVPAAARPARPDPPQQPARPAKEPAQPVDNTVAKAEPPVKKAQPPVTPSQPSQPSRNPVNHGAEVVTVSTRQPLGLRYSILKQVSGGGTTEVDGDSVFRSGDRIRLTIATTETAYVYVVTRGSSGKWRVLFPAPEIGQGSNLIPGGVIYPIPAGHWFAFDEQVGTENLFVMVSRTPERDLDSLIYQLKESGGNATPSPDEPPVLMATNIPPVDDTVITRLRSEVYARDLVFEKVDDTVPAAGGETIRPERAVYVVNKTGADDSRVVADIKLEHR
ncbi:MAG: DUF4384 domain-containing protein [Bryobacterales bacterium]